MPHAGYSRLGKRLLSLAVAATALTAVATYIQWDVITGVMASQLEASQQEASSVPPSLVAQPVRVSRIVFANPAAESRFTGTVRPRHEAELGFRVSGKLLERLVSVGDEVKEGQTIARLDPADAELDLETAEAELSAAKAELARAEAEATRNRKLVASGTVSRAANDRTVATFAEAQGRADRALRARDLAANRLDYMVLTAGTDGIVTRELAEAGQVVAAGQTVVSIARVDQLDVVFALPEQKRAILERSGVTAQLWEQDSQQYSLQLRDVAPDVEPATRTYRVRMALETPDRHVTLGRTVTVTFTAPATTPVAALPLTAVLNDGRGAAVWRLRPDRQSVERVAVDIASLDGERVRVRGGLRDGDLVVSLGAHKIDPSRPVTVVETVSVRIDE